MGRGVRGRGSGYPCHSAHRADGLVGRAPSPARDAPVPLPNAEAGLCGAKCLTRN